MQIKKLPNLAVFDFDGTITNIDTFNDIIISNFGRLKFYSVLFFIFPVVILYKLNLLKNDVPKKFPFNFFFSGISLIEFDKLCFQYTQRLDKQIKKSALSKIKYHQNKNDLVVINSASISNWILPCAKKYNINYILATEIEVINDVVTGKFITPCCYGIEKVNRLRDKFVQTKYNKIYAYGDSRGDKDLLKFSDFSNFRTFKF